jgi:N-acetyl-alpha-D-glucosaminyl L-malate synthase BshA
MYMARRGHQVHFITYSQPVRLDLLEPNVYYHEVNVQDYPLFEYQPYELALSSKMVNVAIKYKLDLVHVHYAIPHAYAAFMAKQILADKGISLPVMTTLHGTDITLVGRNPSYKQAVNFSINHSDTVTTVSASLRDDTLNFFDINREIEVIPNFVDLCLYKSEECPNSFSEENERIISHVSNFRSVKRISDVVKVFAKIYQNQPAVLLMMGDGPEKERSRELARELGVLHKVKYLGKTNDVERILCISDLFLLTSEKESFGLAALEAMGAGVPVISTNTGGLPEVNLNGVTGYTADVGDVETMAENGLNLLQDEEKLQSFRHNARRQAEQFSIEKIGPLYEVAYQQLNAPAPLTKA